MPELSRPDRWAGPIALIVIAAIAAKIVLVNQPPATVPEDAPPGEFSAARAMHDVRQIARAPHPLGSSENLRVRDYLMGRLRGMGLEPEILAVTVTRRNRRGPLVAALVHDIVARIKGNASAGAVMLVAHFDSVPTGPGAGDDAAAVAAILETVRALKAGPPLRNDLIILLTDGEELGLTGAKGFVENYPALRDIKAVFNFEARGDRGPSLLFETGPDNRGLVAALAKAVPYPVTSSLFQAVYKRLPNDTDFTIFKAAGLQGLNFAFVGGLSRYHTMLDNLELLDPRSVQHHGSYALAMVRELGNRPELGRVSGDDIFFSVGRSVVHYEERLALPLAILIAILTLITIGAATREGALSARRVLLGLVVYLAAIAVAIIEAQLMWRLMDWRAGDRMLPFGASYGGPFFAGASAALVIFTLWRCYEWLGPRAGLLNLGAGALMVWLLLALASCVYLPGGSYLIAWPLVFAVIAMRYGPEGDRSSSAAVHGGAAIVAIAPGLILILVAALAGGADATRLMLSVSALLTALMFGLLIPYLTFFTAGRRWIAPRAFAVGALVLIVAGDVTSNFDAAHPRPDSLFYRLDADNGQARWASLDRAPDAWTVQFLRGSLEQRPLEFSWSGFNDTIEAPAPVQAMSAPSLAVLNDSTADGVRTVRMHIASARGAPVIWLSLLSDSELLGASADGKPFEAPNGKWNAWYWGVPSDGFDLEMKLKAGQPFKLRVIDQTAGLPEIAGVSDKPRPPGFMPSPALYFGSATLVSKSFDMGTGAR